MESVVPTSSDSDQVVVDDIVRTEVLRDLIMDLSQALIISSVVDPTENAVVLKELLAARLHVVISPIVVVNLTTKGNLELSGLTWRLLYLYSSMSRIHYTNLIAPRC